MWYRLTLIAIVIIPNVAHSVERIGLTHYPLPLPDAVRGKIHLYPLPLLRRSQDDTCAVFVSPTKGESIEFYIGLTLLLAFYSFLVLAQSAQ